MTCAHGRSMRDHCDKCADFATTPEAVAREEGRQALDVLRKLVAWDRRFVRGRVYRVSEWKALESDLDALCDEARAVLGDSPAEDTAFPCKECPTPVGCKQHGRCPDQPPSVTVTATPTKGT